jgi:hypothetical protein
MPPPNKHDPGDGHHELPVTVELLRSYPTSEARSWVSSASHASGASGTRSRGSSDKYGTDAKLPDQLSALLPDCPKRRSEYL